MYDGVNLLRHAKSDRTSVGVKGTRCQGMQNTLVTLHIYYSITLLRLFDDYLIRLFDHYLIIEGSKRIKLKTRISYN